MIAGLKPYAEMKDSGVDWLGDVPAHWDIVPAFVAYRPRDVRNTGMAEKTVLSLSYGRIVIKPEKRLRGLVPESFETYQIVEPGNIIVRTTDLQNDRNSLRIGHAKDRGIITSAYLCLETTSQVENEFGYQYLNAYDLLKIIYGFGSGLRQNLDFKDIKRMPVLLPPKDEQVAVVRFLDHADRRIRRAIAAKQKLIRLLEEQKRAIIHRAVTRGLDPGVRFKPSGIEWLGDVPAHWEIRAFSRCAIERADYRGATPAKTESGIFLVTARNVRKGMIDYQISKEYIAESDYATVMRRGLPKIGDVLLTMEAPLGNVALVDREGVAFAQRVVRFRMDPEKLVPEFVLNSMLSPYFQNQLLSRGTGSTALGIKASKLPQLRILCPSVFEQNEILEHLCRDLTPINAAMDRTRAEIELLREYRIRMVADVVTGKIDVRAAAAEIPEMIEADDTEFDAVEENEQESMEDGAVEDQAA
jgi:type I restriction enzyme S subunit